MDEIWSLHYSSMPSIDESNEQIETTYPANNIVVISKMCLASLAAVNFVGV